MKLVKKKFKDKMFVFVWRSSLGRFLTTTTTTAATLAEEPDGHFLLDVSAFQNFAELLKRNEGVLVDVRLHDGPFGDGVELVVRDVGSDHHRQDRQQLLLGDLVVAVQVVHSESN